MPLSSTTDARRHGFAMPNAMLAELPSDPNKNKFAAGGKGDGEIQNTSPHKAQWPCDEKPIMSTIRSLLQWLSFTNSETPEVHTRRVPQGPCKAAWHSPSWSMNSGSKDISEVRITNSIFHNTVDNYISNATWKAK